MHMIVNALLVLTLAGLFVGCGDLESKSANNEGAVTDVDHSTVLETETGENEVVTKVDSLTFSDSYFTDNKWYFYSFWNGHRIYPLLDVLAIQSEGLYFKLQVINYYNDENQSGYYRLRLQQGDSEIVEINVDAFGCGMPIGGITKVCDSKDLFTLVKLSTLEITEMNEADALQSDTWDIGFNRTDVILNSKSNGRGDVTAALVFRNKDLFDKNGKPDTSKLTEAMMNGAELTSFENVGRLAE